MKVEQKKPILEMRGISKEFLRVKANDRVDFELYPGEICALLGENGAGKSTLMKILAGLYQADEGEIYLDGRRVEITCPRDAIRLGIGMVFQHFNLVPSHQVWENIILGMEEGVLNKNRACREIERISRELGLKINPSAYVWQLSVGEKQKVEIVKVLYRKAGILILDEPTAVLTPQEAETLFAMLRRMAQRGLSIVFISHKLKEVMSITDRVEILSNGRVVGSVRTRDSSPEDLACMMVGKGKISYVRNEEHRVDKKVVLQVKSLSVMGDMGHRALKGVSFEILKGEILGLAGVSGNGQKELAEVLSGMRRIEDGEIRFEGELLPQKSPSGLVRRGWARIPDDRMNEGLILGVSIGENLLLEVHARPEFRKGCFINFRQSRQFVKDIIERYDIRPPLGDLKVQNLSGGNIQRVILARELFLNPRMVIAAQPTRGLDVKAANDIQQHLLNQKDKGAAILLISEDLDEILGLSDRIGVIYEGEIVSVMDWTEADRSEIGLMMAGVRPDRVRNQVCSRGLDPSSTGEGDE